MEWLDTIPFQKWSEVEKQKHQSIIKVAENYCIIILALFINPIEQGSKKSWVT